MKQLLLMATLALSALSVPVIAMGYDLSSVTPVLTFPEPVPEPVTQDAGGIDAQ